MATKRKTKAASPPPEDPSTTSTVPVDGTVPPAAEEADMAPKMPTIPLAKRAPKTAIDRSMIWLFGDNGVGKSTLASKFPGCWFWATEPGQEFIHTYEPHLIHSWDHFLETCKWMEDTKPTTIGKERLKYICIDTVDLLFKMCNESVCAGFGIEDPSEMGHGKAWARLGAEFERVMAKIRRWPYGLILISHQRDREVTSRARKITRLEPDIGAAGRRVLGGLSDFIIYCSVKDVVQKNKEGDVTGEFMEQRMLQLHPTSNVVGKSRKGVEGMPSEIPMDYDALIEALEG